MAKDGNTYAKRQRETLKRQKAEAKRARRQKRKEPTGDPEAPRSDSHLDHVDPVRQSCRRDVVAASAGLLNVPNNLMLAGQQILRSRP